ncbi:MAG: right-handed parallel beta-helix repeat-containing protein, partial [Anaerolineae bacterium]
VSNTRFEGNQAGAYGGALYVIGEWREPLSDLRADVILANTTFVNNHAIRHASVNASFPTEGGAVNVEDQSLLRVYHSNFVNNSAMIGGGINVYRANVEVYKSVFQGNSATGTVFGSSFGGSISLNSADGPDNGYNNWPSAQLKVEDTLLQGRYEGVTTVAQTGGCIFAGGDGTRIDGDSGVPDMGTVAENRVNVELRRVVLYDCDVQAVGASGVGGALQVTIADLTMENSLVLNSDALGSTASGGGAAILYDSVAEIVNSTFAHNTTGGYGGGLFAQGSHVDVRDSRFIGNEVTPGYAELYWESYGAAIFFTPDIYRNISARGTVERNEFTNNVGMAIYDDDRSTGPINDVRYNDNDFFETTFENDVYRGSLSGAQDPAGLNALVINRSNGTQTDKSTVDNRQFPEEPMVLGYATAPQEVLYYGAAGDPSSPRTAYVALAWNRGEAVLNSTELTERVHLQEISSPGTYLLSVEGESYPVEIGETSSPDADFNLQMDGSRIYLNWYVTEGDFIEVAIDQGLNVNSGSSGSVEVPADPSRNYSLYVLTEEGGVVKTLDTSVPLLSVAESTFYFAEL